MILILKEKPNKEQLADLTNIYPGYTKVVVDIKRNLLAAGGEYHIDCEQVFWRMEVFKATYGEGAIGLRVRRWTLSGLLTIKLVSGIYPTKLHSQKFVNKLRKLQEVSLTKKDF